MDVNMITNAHQGLLSIIDRNVLMNELDQVEVEEVSGGLEPSLGGFLLYLMTGKINGIQF